MNRQKFRDIIKEAPRVLIGEKDGIVAADLEALFQSCGFQRPRVARNVEEIFNYNDKESFDIVVVDENIHDCHNFAQTLRHLLNSMSGQIVYISDFLSSRLPDSLLNNSALHSISKPFNYNELQFIAESAMMKEVA
ncbi:hypothetical protein KAR48_15825 [bacterium]|nr:hypothetical protein [bacterium]